MYEVTILRPAPDKAAQDLWQGVATASDAIGELVGSIPCCVVQGNETRGELQRAQVLLGQAAALLERTAGRYRPCRGEEPPNKLLSACIAITLNLESIEAAALHRLCDKLGHSEAMAFLYPHIVREIRSTQAYDMVGVCGLVQKALEDAGVRHWPWIETGSVEGVSHG